MSSAECLLQARRGARIAERTDVNVGGGAHGVVPSAHAPHAGTSREAGMTRNTDGACAAGGVAATEWLAATFGSACGARDEGVRASADGDGHLHDHDTTPLLSPLDVAQGGGGDKYFG